MANWIEVRVDADGEAAEAISELFNRYGEGGAVIEESPHDGAAPSVAVKAYLPDEPASADRLRAMEEGLWHLGRLYPIPEPAIRTLAEQDWANAWKAGYTPQRIGRLLIVPSWLTAELGPGDIAIWLDPGMAFGTGLHPTTRLCLAALQDHVGSGQAVLDVGAGSGILAIAAAKLGASQVVALDIDDTAVRVASENAAKNGVEDRVVVAKGTLPLEGPAVFDVVVANILAPVIIELAPAIADVLARGGTFIVSGILEEQGASVEEALAFSQLRITARRQERDWLALVGGKR